MLSIPEVEEFKFKPELIKMQVFGNPDHPIDLEFPKVEDLANFPLHKRIKLQSVHWKNSKILKGIQLKFTNGIETPFF